MSAMSRFATFRNIKQYNHLAFLVFALNGYFLQRCRHVVIDDLSAYSISFVVLLPFFLVP